MPVIEVAVGLLIMWVLVKANRAADAVVDQAIDADVDKVGQLILTKLAGDPAVDRLQVEATEQGKVRDHTTKSVEAMERAAERDPVCPGRSPHPAGEPPRHPHQVRVVQLVLAALVRPPPPGRNPPGA